MFEKICIKPNETSYPTDIGFIAETLLYYDQVTIVAGASTFPILVERIGISNLIELLKSGDLRILIQENILGVSSHPDQRFNLRNDIMLISSPNVDSQEVIYRGIFEFCQRQGYSRRMTRKLLPLTSTIRYQSDIDKIVKEDLSNENYVTRSVINSITHYNPSLTYRPEEIEYQFIDLGDGFVFKTNLNYPDINNKISRGKNVNLINPESLILNIMETRGDMHIASDLKSEIATALIRYETMKLKFNDIYQKTAKGKKDLIQFNEFVLDDGFAIRDTINSGLNSFDDFMMVYRKAKRFKEWLNGVEPEVNLIQEYHKAVIAETKLDKLPGKTTRWGIFTGAGLLLDTMLTGGLGTIIQLGLSAGDTFLFDKLVKGWKPNVFVNKELYPFTKDKK